MLMTLKLTLSEEAQRIWQREVSYFANIIFTNMVLGLERKMNWEKLEMNFWIGMEGFNVAWMGQIHGLKLPVSVQQLMRNALGTKLLI